MDTKERQTKVMEELGGEEAVRERLQTRREEILDLYESDVKAGQAASNAETDDLVDRANNAYRRELLFSLSSGERTELIRIEDALNRIDEGFYGSCIHCERPIGVPRLEAMPAARYCVECQELDENGMLEED
ncbi:MAG: TraR/DksA family transcriptional regulator [Thermoanaerobaculia bacterium]|nr:TraR/DksA family transcriptional regulator [Thermoanaerobaculia bacterium]